MEDSFDDWDYVEQVQQQVQQIQQQLDYIYYEVEEYNFGDFSLNPQVQEIIEDEDDVGHMDYMQVVLTMAHSIVTCALAYCNNDTPRRLGCPTIRRERVPVEIIFSNLGPRLFRKCYRMSEPLFWKLHRMLQPYMKYTNGKRKRGATINGQVTSSARLSMTLRWFAGGEPADILQVHGVSYAEVYVSIWIVIDAINICPHMSPATNFFSY